MISLVVGRDGLVYRNDIDTQHSPFLVGDSWYCLQLETLNQQLIDLVYRLFQKRHRFFSSGHGPKRNSGNQGGVVEFFSPTQRLLKLCGFIGVKENETTLSAQIVERVYSCPGWSENLTVASSQLSVVNYGQINEVAVILRCSRQLSSRCPFR